MSRIPVKLQILNPISNYSLFNDYTDHLFAIILIDAIAQILKDNKSTQSLFLPIWFFLVSKVIKP